MKVSMASTVRPSTMKRTDDAVARSTLGVIDVSITVGGSVASMSLNSAVHENVRASIMRVGLDGRRR